MTAHAWWRDFRLEGGAVRVLKTGALVPVEPGVIGETLAWLRFWMEVETEARAIAADGPRIWFAPDRPRPWYLVRAALALGGLRMADRPETADLGFYFEDVTTGAPPAAPGLIVLNGGCADVSKSRVASVFEAATGRALAVDPTRWDGPMAIKSERNGAHDGRLAMGPLPAPEPGLVYQRLIDTMAADGRVEDLRCPTVGGEIAAVFLKRRPAAERFANHNSEVRLLDPDAAFTAAERTEIARFCAGLGLDWGGLDILRERDTGLLWIVDANKTDMGPPTALALADKMTAARTLGRRLRALAERRIAGDPSA